MLQYASPEQQSQSLGKFMNQATSVQPVKSPSRVGIWLKRISYASVVLGLVASNVASVLNTSFHDLLYGAVSSQLLAVAPDMASRVLAQTPTKRLANEKAKFASAQKSVKSFKSGAVKRLVRQKVVSIATLPERVIPVASVLVIAGATIYEINSDCELFKDINQLSKAVGASDVEPNESEICGFSLPTGGVSEAISDFKNEMASMNPKDQLKSWLGMNAAKK